MARPIRLPPPVTSATRPCKSFSLIVFNDSAARSLVHWAAIFVACTLSGIGLHLPWRCPVQDASLEDITKFLACKRVALVGVSRNPHHFSRALMGEFLAKGYDAVPINPNCTEIQETK